MISIVSSSQIPSKKRELPLPEPATFAAAERCLNEVIESPQSVKNRKLSATIISPSKETHLTFDGVVPANFTGFATLKNEDGSIYHGHFTNGVRHGMGALVWPGSEGSYIGKWVNGVRQNRAVMTYNDGSKYIGEMKKGARDGYGRYEYLDGTIYQGQWKENLRSGPGFRTLPDGSVVTGKWIADKIEGMGRLFYPNGEHELAHYIRGHKITL